jgi:hemoglobin/transferrin/lactoferrin receptor protein
MDGGTVTAYGIYAQDAFEISDFRFVTGLRYDVHKLGGVFSGKYDQLSPKFQGEHQTTDNLRLRVGYGRLFKGAALPETLTMKAASDVNQADTKAMTGNNYEAGFNYSLSSELVFGWDSRFVPGNDYTD